MPHWLSQLLGAIAGALAFVCIHQVKDLKLGEYSSRLAGVIIAGMVWYYLYIRGPILAFPYLPELVIVGFVVMFIIYCSAVFAPETRQTELKALLKSGWLLGSMVCLGVANYLFAQ